MANDKAARLATALRANADQLRKHLPGGDTQLVSINDQEAAMLRQMGGSGKRDPITGIISFDSEGGGEGPGAEGGGNGPGMGADGGDSSGGGNGGSGGVKSSSAADEPGAVSNTASQTGLSGLANDIGVGMQSALTGLSNSTGLSQGALTGGLMGLATGGLPGAMMGGLMGAAGVPGIGTAIGALADHGVNTGNQPGVGPGLGGSFGAPVVGQSPNQTLATALRG